MLGTTIRRVCSFLHSVSFHLLNVNKQLGGFVFSLFLLLFLYFFVALRTMHVSSVGERKIVNFFFNFSEEIKKSFFYYPRSFERSPSNEASSMDTQGGII